MPHVLLNRFLGNLSWPSPHSIHLLPPGPLPSDLTSPPLPLPPPLACTVGRRQARVRVPLEPRGPHRGAQGEASHYPIPKLIALLIDRVVKCVDIFFPFRNSSFHHSPSSKRQKEGRNPRRASPLHCTILIPLNPTQPQTPPVFEKEKEKKHKIKGEKTKVDFGLIQSHPIGRRPRAATTCSPRCRCRSRSPRARGGPGAASSPRRSSSWPTPRPRRRSSSRASRSPSSSTSRPSRLRRVGFRTQAGDPSG
jgi:hypothetical protein